MKDKTIILLVLMIFIIGCCRQYLSIEDIREKGLNLECNSENFTLAAIERAFFINEPFIVKKIKGRFINNSGKWDDENCVLLELQNVLKENKIISTKADKNGFFKMKNVPEGIYCFKATLYGWESVMGKIVVSNKANPKNDIIIELVLE